jgi:hypothetical protein
VARSSAWSAATASGIAAAGTGEDHGEPCLAQQGDRVGDRRAGRAAGAAGRSHREADRGRRRRHVVGEHDGGRAARFARRRAERVHDRLGDVVGGGDLAGRDRDGLQHADGIHRLVRALEVLRARDGAADRDDRVALGGRGEKPVARFVGAGAARDQHDARDAGEAADRGGHEDGVLLGAAGHELRRAGLALHRGERVEDGVDLRSRHAEHPPHAVGASTSTTRSAAREHRSRSAGPSRRRTGAVVDAATGGAMLMTPCSVRRRDEEDGDRRCESSDSQMISSSDASHASAA